MKAGKREFNQGAIKALRERLNLSQGEFARRLNEACGGNFQKQHVHHWENKGGVSTTTLVNISDTFEVPVDDFFRPRRAGRGAVENPVDSVATVVSNSLDID